MKTTLPITAALAAAVILPVTAAEPNEALAKVGAVEVTVADVKPRLENLSESDRAALAADPALLNRFVRSMIVEQMLLRNAQSAKWDKDPKVEAQLEQLREKALAQSYLQSVSEPPKDYPGDAELKAAYEENKAALQVPRQYRIAQIFVALSSDANKETTANAKVKVDEIASALKKSGANFTALAKARSEEPQSAANGGIVGWLTLDQIQPGIREALGGLNAGSVSDPIRLADGIHFVKVLEVKEPYTPDLAEIRDALAQRMREAKTKQNSEAYLTRMLEESPVAINEIVLGDLLPKPAKGTSSPNAKN